MGTLSRYGMITLATRTFGDRLPYGTLLVNVLGSLLIGFVMQLGLSSQAIPPSLRVPLVVGFLGAFTTFSTFSYETARYLQAGDWTPALANIGLNLFLCLFATGLGFVAGRVILAAP